jgi:hypothetical protein
MKLNDYKLNLYSQNGEDGIINELLKRFPNEIQNKWCVEFGAWDGIHLSNTCNLIKNLDYQAVLIEASRKKFRDLQRNFPSSNVIKINKLVGFEGDNSLDNILIETKIPSDFDFLSIDIDGCDYWIWDSLVLYSPKIVCIEFNQTIPNIVEYINPRDFRIKHGSSAKSLIKLGSNKFYSLVASTDTNLFFVKNELMKYINEIELDLSDANLAGNNPVFIYSGYDGTLFSSTNEISLNWHVKLNLSNFQILPSYLRAYPGDYNFFQKYLLILWIIIKKPSLIHNKFRRVWKKILRLLFINR